MVRSLSIFRGATIAAAVFTGTWISTACATGQLQPQTPTSTPSTATNTAEPQLSPSPSATAAEAPTPSAEPDAATQEEPPPTPAEIAANEIAEKVWAFYRDKKTFKAQTTRWVMIRGHEERRQGAVRFRRPDRFALRESEPKLVVVGDGHSIRSRSGPLGRLHEASRQDDAWSPLFMFLWENLTKSHRLRMGRVTNLRIPGFEDGLIVGGSPKDSTATYKSFSVSVDEHTHEVRGVYVAVRRTRVQFGVAFTKPEYNIDIPDSEFVLDVPEGTEVVTP